MLHEWENFYLMIGSAAAALIGLLFVVASLAAPSVRESDSIQRGTSIYASPIVFHLAFIVLMSALSLIPHLSLRGLCLAAGLSAVGGLLYAARVSRLLHADPRPPGFDWTDFWFYGVGPLLLYVTLVAVASSIRFVPHLVPAGIGLTILGLLLLSIRNAWDLVTYLAPQPRD